MFVEHLQGQFVPGAETHLRGHAGLLAAPFVLGPVLGQVEARIDQGVALVADVAEVDTDLAVFDFAKAAAPLALYAHGLGALLGEGGGVEDQDGGVLTQTVADLAGKFADQRGMVPVNLSDELLEPLAFSVMEVGDALGVLAAQVGQQAADVMVGVDALLGADQRLGERLQEALQAWQHAAQQPRADLRVVEQLIQTGLIAGFHGSSPLGRPTLPEVLYANALRSEP